MLYSSQSKRVDEQHFLGAGYFEQRGAFGILDAIETAFINTVGHDVTEYIFKNISLIVTDGTPQWILVVKEDIGWKLIGK